MSMRGMILSSTAAFGAMVLWAAAAHAAQCATVSFSPGSITIPNWNPITPGAQQATFTMTVTRLNNTTNAIRMIFLDSNDQSQPVYLGAIGAQNGPQYQLLDSAGDNQLYPKNSNVASLKGQPAFSWQSKNSNSTVTGSFRVLVPANSPGTDFRNGTYAETLSYSIQCLNNGNATNLIDTASGPAVSLTIPNLVSLTSASAATLDFQNFTSLTQQLNVGLKSTGPVNVAINSSNKLKMVRSGAPSPYADNSKIDYLMSLRGISVGALPQTLTSQPRAGVAGTSWPLVLSLPAAPSGKVAGSYSDTITITLSPGT